MVPGSHLPSGNVKRLDGDLRYMLLAGIATCLVGELSGWVAKNMGGHLTA